MKKIMGFIFCLAATLVFGSGVFASDGGSAAGDSSSAAEPYFYYSYSDGSGRPAEDYSIWSGDGRTYFDGGGMFLDIDVYAEADASIFDELLKVIKANGIEKWDGFDKYAEDLYDGGSFTLTLEYGEESIDAYGYGYTPENYETGSAALHQFLRDYAQSLPKGVPSPESVNYVTVEAGDFRFYIDYSPDANDVSGSGVDALEISRGRTDDKEEVQFGGYAEESWPPDAYGYDENSSPILFDEPGLQIRERLLGLELKPRDAELGADQIYAQIQFSEDRASQFDHALQVVMPPEELDWFVGKVREIIRLPEDYDLNLLFEDDGASYSLPEPTEENAGASGGAAGTVQVLNESSEPGYFEYQYGSNIPYEKNKERGRFRFWTEDGKTHFYAEAPLHGKRTEVFAEADPAVFNQIFSLIKENGIESWDGLYNNSEAESGKHFSLTAKYGKDFIQSYGYADLPENYESGHKALRDFLIAYAEDLPLYIPSPEMVRHVYINAGDRGITLNYGLHDDGSLYVYGVDILRGVEEGPVYVFAARRGSNYDEPVFNDEPARQIIEKILSLDLSEGSYPGGGADAADAYADVKCNPGGSNLEHNLNAVLTDGEEKWLIEKVIETLKLPEGDNLDLLLD